MLGLVLVARRGAASCAAQHASIAPISHLLATLRAQVQTPSVLARAVASWSQQATRADSAFARFYESVKKLDHAVHRDSVKWTEPIFDEVEDAIRMDATDEDKRKAAERCVDAYKKLKSKKSSVSVRLTLGKSVADFYQYKLDQPDLAVQYYLEVLAELSALQTDAMADWLQVDMLSNVAKCYKKLGKRDDAELYFQRAIEAHEQHRKRRGLAPASDVDLEFHSKVDFAVLDLQLVFMEHLLAAKRWDEIQVLLERVVEQVEDAPHLTSPEKLAEIQVMINKSVEWLAEAEKPKPRVVFGIPRGDKSDMEQLVSQRRQVNQQWGLDPDEGVVEMERERAILAKFAEMSKPDEDLVEATKRAEAAYKQLKTAVPKGCGACTMALTIASAYYSQGQFPSALSYYLEALEIFASTSQAQFRRGWHVAWVERKVMHIGALCAIASCYQQLNDYDKANVFFVQASSAYDLVRDRILAPDSERDPVTFALLDHRALCPSTDDEDELLSGLALTVASTLVDYAENLSVQGDWRTAKTTTDRALELAEGCTITEAHVKARVDRLMKGVQSKSSRR